MDSVHYQFEQEEMVNSPHKWIITDGTIVAPYMKPCMVRTFVIALYNKSSNFYVYYNAIALVDC